MSTNSFACSARTAATAAVETAPLSIDGLARHPSQLYEAFLEGMLLFVLMIIIFFLKNYKIGSCSYFFLIFYGCFRIFSEFFREPDSQIGYLYNQITMGMTLSFIMIVSGIIIFLIKKNDV